MQATGLKGFRLSIQQARLWALQQESGVYRSQCAVLLKGKLDVAILLRALQGLVCRHDILRTAFSCLPGMQVPLQLVAEYAQVFCPLIDLEELAESNQSSQLDRCFAALQQERLDLEYDSLLYATILRLSDTTHALLISLPALCADGSTLKEIVSELFQLYVALLQGENLCQEPLQYADVSAWQDKLLASEDAELLRQYWSKIDLSKLTTTHIPFEQENYHSDKASAFVPLVLEVPLEEELSRQVRLLAHQYSAPISTWLLTCWHVLLWRLSDGSSPIVGVACDGRNYEELSNALGLYTRTVPMGPSLAALLPFEQVIALVNTSLQEAIKWQTYFTWESACGTMEKSATPLFFPVAFEYDSWPVAFTSSDLAISLYRRFSCAEPFVFKLSVLELGEQLQLEVQYDPQLLMPEQADRLTALLHTLLQSTAEQPQAAIGTLRILPAREQDYLISTVRGTNRSLPELSLHRLIEAQAERLPDQPAVVSMGEQLTYRQLNSRANQLARVLQRRGVGPNVLVGLSMERSAQMIVGLLAILKAGGAYVPLDAESPAGRLASQLQDSQATLLLTQQALFPRLPQWGGITLCLEELSEELAQEPEYNLLTSSEPEDLAYMIYTSGSTGVPKGVMIRQSSVVNYTLAMSELLGSEPGWQYATVSTLAADLGNTAIFCALASGGCLQVLSYKTITSADAFAHWTTQHPLDVLKIVPSHLSALLADEEQARELLPRRALVSGGEVLSFSFLERLRKSGGSCCVYNHYGPTETTVGVLVNVLGLLHAPAESVESEAQGRTVPVGRPLANSEVYVLDGSQQLVPVGLTGELYIGGAGLAVGYLHQPEQTAERFVPHPFGRQGERLYRTGDLARYTKDGKIEFVGRRDSQVKLRGYRIELGEIETVLRRHANVWDTVVLLREDIPGEPRIVGYVVPRHQPGPTQQALRDFVKEQLPEYMVPSVFVMLDSLPLTTNGKIDRRQLPIPEQGEDDRPSVLIAPRSPIEEILRDIWKELLAVPTVSLHDDFFQLGGHSLLATQVIARIRTVLQVELSILSLFEAPTIAQLAHLVEQILRGGQIMQAPPLVPVPRSQDLPLSFAQQRLWLLDQLEPESTAYLLPHTRRLYGSLNIAALERSLQELLQRHEILRTTFEVHAGQPVQVIHTDTRFCLPLIDLHGLTVEEGESVARQLARQEAQQPCDLVHGPLLRVSLLRLSVQEHVLLLTMHHIISDGWSNGVLVRELGVLYPAFAAGRTSPLLPLPIQYADFALWQRQWLQGEGLEAQLAYWKRQLAGLPPLELPTDYPRPPLQAFQGTLQSICLPLPLQEQLIALSQREGVTLFMLLLAAFQVLLARYSGQSDVSVGTPIANRTRAELEGLIGFFVNTLVLRTDLSGSPSFLELLKRVREVALKAYAFQDAPFEQLVEELQPQRDLSRSPLFQVMFSVQHNSVDGNRAEIFTPSSPEKQDPLTIKEESPAYTTTKFDLEVNMLSSKRGLHCAVAYRTDLFAASTIARLLEHFQVLLEGIVAQSQATIDRLPLLTGAERQHLLVACNRTQRPYPLERSCADLLSNVAASIPQRVAIIDEQTCLTYGELERRATQLARRLHQVGVGPEVLVGLHLERSVEWMVAILAVWKAGGAYVPLDPGWPRQRLATILEQADVQVVLTQEASPPSLVESRAVVDGRGVSQALTEGEQQAMTGAKWPEQLAYVIYTSGSTGQPKGAMLTQKGMLNHLWAKIETLQLDHRDRVAQTASASFDISIWQCWAALLVGAQVCIIPDAVVQDAASLCEQMAVEQFSILEVVPSLLRMLQDVCDQRAYASEWQSNLRCLVVTGEAFPAELARRWIERYPQVSLLNAYGPTECSDDVTQAWLSSAVLKEATSAAIGQVLGNTQLYLLDQELEPVPSGVVGEIYIGGSGVGRGYLGNPVATATAFMPDPFGGQPGGRFYKTGDLGRYRADGQLEFVRRVDHQVKVRGYRIELGEIEAALEQHPAVFQAVVIVREDRAGDQRLVAYVVPKEGKTVPAERELDSFLHERVPHYMVPSAIVALEAMPLTATGKVNRGTLPTPQQGEKGVEQVEWESINPLEELLQGIWGGVLGRNQVGLHENFFELGGHSLLGTQLLARVRAVLQVNLPLRSLFEAPTIAALARHVEQTLHNRLDKEAPALVPVSREQDLPLSFAQQRLWFLDQLEPGNIAYTIAIAVRLAGTLNIAALERSIYELMCRHESLRTVFQIKGNQPVQIIQDIEKVDLSITDIHGLSPERREMEARSLVQQETHQPFDLARGPLFRARLMRLTETEYVLLLSMHHIVSDGWSMTILVQELSSLYIAFVTGKSSPLPELLIQYADFAYWQRQWLQGEVLEAQLSYWTHQLGGSRPLSLPTDYPRPEVLSYRGGAYAFALASPLSEAVVALSRQEGVTVFMTLLAAFQTLLYRYTGQTDVLVGTDMANRTHVETEALIGFFINLLVLRNDLSGAPSFRDLLHRTREIVLGAYTHQDTPFEMLVERLLPDHSLDRMPLVQVLFVLQNQPSSYVQLPNVTLNHFAGAETMTAKFDLALFMIEGPGGFRGIVKYSSDLFKPGTIATMMSRFEELLHNVIANPDVPLDIVDIYPADEKAQQARQQKNSLRRLKAAKGEEILLPGIEANI